MAFTKRTVMYLTVEALRSCESDQFIHDTNEGKLNAMIADGKTDGEWYQTVLISDNLGYITLLRNWTDEVAANEWKTFTSNTLATAGVPIQDYVIENYTPPA